MKKIGLILTISLLAMGCNQDKNQHHKIENTEQVSSNNPNAKVCPVCGMSEMKIPWTDYSLYQGDTVWFCSPHDKSVFDKNPEEYADKL